MPGFRARLRAQEPLVGLLVVSGRLIRAVGSVGVSNRQSGAMLSALLLLASRAHDEGKGGRRRAGIPARGGGYRTVGDAVPCAHQSPRLALSLARASECAHRGTAEAPLPFLIHIRIVRPLVARRNYQSILASPLYMRPTDEPPPPSAYRPCIPVAPSTDVSRDPSWSSARTQQQQQPEQQSLIEPFWQFDRLHEAPRSSPCLSMCAVSVP